MVSLLEDDASGRSDSHTRIELFKLLISVWERNQYLGKNLSSIQDLPWGALCPLVSMRVGFAGVDSLEPILRLRGASRVHHQPPPLLSSGTGILVTGTFKGPSCGLPRLPGGRKVPPALAFNLIFT